MESVCQVELEGHSSYSLEFPADRDGVERNAMDIQEQLRRGLRVRVRVGISLTMLSRDMGMEMGVL